MVRDLMNINAENESSNLKNQKYSKRLITIAIISTVLAGSYTLAKTNINASAKARTTLKSNKKTIKTVLKKKKNTKKVNISISKYQNDSYGTRYFDNNGKYVTGLVEINGGRQYFSPKGYLYKNKLISISDNYKMFADGNGNIVTNSFINANNKTYYINGNGVSVKGLQVINGKRYIFDNDSSLEKGKLEDINGTQMYSDPATGEIVTNKNVTVNNTNYHADLNGKLTVDNSKTSESLLTNNTFSQNFHYNVPRGYSNDIQSIVPHKDANGNVDYYDVYYLYDPNPNQQKFSDEWYHVTTKDFKTFTPFDPSDATSLNNVAIPFPSYTGPRGASGNQVVEGNKTFWRYVATGSVFPNDGLLTKDKWGNPIDKDAKLAYFTDLNDLQQNFLVYSNNDEQFRPYQDTPSLTAPMFHINGADFRDIQIQKQSDGEIIAYVTGGWAKKVYTFRSRDAVNWTHNPDDDIDLSSFNSGAFEIETPLVRTINGQTFMFFSWHSGDTRASSYVTGKIVNNVFKPDANNKFYSVDGSDFKSDIYAGNSENLDSGNLININWSGNWLYSPLGTPAYDSITMHSGSFALSRIIQNDNGQLKYLPIEPDNKLVNSYRIGSSAQSILVNTNNKLDFTFDSADVDKTLVFKRKESTLTITINKNGIEVKRENSLNPTLYKDVITQLSNTNISKIQAYVDNASIELYLPEANKSYNIVNFSSIANEPYFMTTSASATIDNYQFGQSDETNNNEVLNKDISTLQGYLNNDELILNGLRNEDNGSQKDKIDGALSRIQQSRDKIATAQSNIQKSIELGVDVRSSQYTSIAKDYYKEANDVERTVASIIMDVSNNAQNNGFEDRNGNFVINGHNTLFNNGKRLYNKIVSDSNGNMHYYDTQTGYEAVDTFLVDNGSYYYFDNDGNMVKNKFIEVTPGSNKYYYFNSEGKAVTGVVTIDGSKYKFDNSGIMLSNTISKNDDGTVSYYGLDGKMATSATTINNESYDIDANGNILGNNVFVQSPTDPTVYYLLLNNKVSNDKLSDDISNNKFNGVIKVQKNQFIVNDGSIFYLKKDGNFSKSTEVIGGKKYYFSDKGYLNAKDTIITLPNGKKYYLNNDSKIQGGIHDINGTAYAFDAKGNLRNRGTVKYKGKKYTISKNGTVKGLRIIHYPTKQTLIDISNNINSIKIEIKKDKSALKKKHGVSYSKMKSLKNKLKKDTAKFNSLNKNKKKVSKYLSAVDGKSKSEKLLFNLKKKRIALKKTIKRHNNRKNRRKLTKLNSQEKKVNKEIKNFKEQISSFRREYK